MFSRIILSIIIYIICILLLFKYKPNMMFKRDGELKIFDYDSDNGTLLPIELILVIIAIICYLLVLSLELVST